MRYLTYLSLQIKAQDDDFGEFGQISYTIHSEFMKQKFAMDRNSGRITTLGRLDREEQKFYDVPICAMDGGGKLNYMTLRVKVQDENDCTPEFEFKEYKSNIYTNTTVGTVFLKVKAHDCDENSNGQIEYSIYENQNSGVLELFAINPATGGIFVLKNSAAWGKFNIYLTDDGFRRHRLFLLLAE